MDFLVSNYTPFSLCPKTGEARRVKPKLCVDNIPWDEGPEIGMRNAEMPWELTEKVLDYLVMDKLRRREFEECQDIMQMNKRMLDKWARWLGCGRWRTLRQKVVGIDKMLFLLGAIDERAIDKRVLRKKRYGWAELTNVLNHETGLGLGEALDQMLEEVASQEDEGWGLLPDHYPVLQMENPYWTHVRANDAITPCSVVGRGPYGLDTQLSIADYPDGVVVLSDFECASPTGGWAGDRMCDLMVMDAEVDDGVFHARKVVFPLLLVSVIEPKMWGTGQGADARLPPGPSGNWKRAKEEWDLFADLMELCFEGCGVYIEKPELPAGRWGCRYFERLGTNK